jgi:uncharacterized membrane protein YkoI
MHRRAALVVTGTAILSTLGGAEVALASSSASSGDAHASAAAVAAPARAVRTAGRAAGGRPYSIDRERIRGATAWEVDVARASGPSRELHISGDGRRVLRRRTERRTADANRARRVRIGLAAALRTAARRANGTLDGADIDRERGVTVWSVIFTRRGNETEVYVNARTGRVVRVEHDD